MGSNKKKREETGGLQQPKMTVAEREEQKVEKEKTRKKDRKKREKDPNRVGLFGRIRNMFSELKKVQWPTFAATVAKTGVVLSVVVVFSLVIFGIDQGLAQLYNLLTRGL